MRSIRGDLITSFHSVRVGDARAQKNSERYRSGEELSFHKVDYGTLFSLSVTRGGKGEKRGVWITEKGIQEVKL